MNYLKWNEKTITSFSEENINSLYNDGYVFARTGKGNMYQTRSLRIDLSKFELSSENKRILKKTEDLKFIIHNIPYSDYTWKIGKLGKDFYETKFGDGTFSANKIKELLTTEHNFNKLFKFILNPDKGVKDLSKPANNELQKNEIQPSVNTSKDSSVARLPQNEPVGYAICHETNKLLHYSYPFYNLEAKSYKLTPNLGMGMMLHAIIWAKANNKKYVYLGSAKDEKARYKLQFSGLEWFDGKTWQINLEELKNILK